MRWIYLESNGKQGSGRVRCGYRGGGRSRSALTWILDGARNIFGTARRVWATALRSDPLKKALCLTRPAGGTIDKYHLESNSYSIRNVMLLPQPCIP